MIDVVLSLFWQNVFHNLLRYYYTGMVVHIGNRHKNVLWCLGSRCCTYTVKIGDMIMAFMINSLDITRSCDHDSINNTNNWGMAGGSCVICLHLKNSVLGTLHNKMTEFYMTDMCMAYAIEVLLSLLVVKYRQCLISVKN